MKTPDDRKYAKEHEWIKMKDEIGTVGITDHAQEQLTDVVFVELPQKGKKVKKDQPMAVIESVKSVSDVYAPVSGEVVEVNQDLQDHPEYINSSPYEKGWILKIKPENPKEVDTLMSGKEYEEFIK